MNAIESGSQVIQVVPAITEEASGPSYSVVRLCESLIRSGQQVTLAALNLAPLSVSPPYLKMFPIGAGPRRLGRSPLMKRWLASEAQDRSRGVVFHNHGMWQMNSKIGRAHV